MAKVDPSYSEKYRNRQTGKSLGLAHQFVGQALSSPNKKIHLFDHTGDKASIKRVIIPYIQKIIQQGKLEGFKINRTDNTLIYVMDDEAAFYADLTDLE